MAKKSLEELRAQVNPEGYLKGLRDVLSNYQGQLARQLVEYDTVDIQEGIDEKTRKEVLNSLKDSMQSSAERIEIMKAKIESVNKPPRAARRADERKAVKKKAKKKR